MGRLIKSSKVEVTWQLYLGEELYLVQLYSSHVSGNHTLKLNHVTLYQGKGSLGGDKHIPFRVASYMARVQDFGNAPLLLPAQSWPEYFL